MTPNPPARETEAAKNPPVLFISVLYYPTVGGSITWVNDLCTDYHGDVSILTQSIEDDAQETPSPFRIHRVSLRTYPWLRPESLMIYMKLDAAAKRIVQKEKPAMVVAARVVPEGVIALRLKRKYGIPFIVLAHGEEITVPWKSPSTRRRLTRYQKLRVMKKVYRGADLVLTNSGNTQEVVKDFAGSEVKCAIHNPRTDPNLFTPDGDNLREKLGLGNRPVILTVGHLMERKGQGNVIEALPSILKRIPDAVYLVAGKGPNEAGLRQIAKNLGVADAVRFLGHVEDADLPALYRSANVFVLANRNLSDGDIEGFGIVYLEAQASGLPIVAGARTGNADAMVDGVTAFRVNPNQTEDLSAAILKILEDTALAKEMGTQGRQFVISHFTSQVLAPAWNQIAQNVQSASNRPSDGPNSETVDSIKDSPSVSSENQARQETAT